MQIDDFTLFHQTRKSNRGGGVAIFVNNGFPAQINPNLSPFVDNIIESITVDIMLKKKKITVCSLYRPPNNSSNSTDRFFTEFGSLLNSMYRNDCPYFLLTDSNFNLINIHNCPNSSNYMEICHNNGFFQHIQKATRISGVHFSLIDHIFTKNVTSSATTGTLLSDISDHFFTFIALSNLKTRSPQREIKKGTFPPLT